jgi:glutathione S-transferase
MIAGSFARNAPVVSRSRGARPPLIASAARAATARATTTTTTRWPRHASARGAATTTTCAASRTLRSRRPSVVAAAAAVLVAPEYGFVMASIASTAALLQFLAIRVALARRKYDVPYPQMYVGDSTTERGRVFDCTQRAHQNTLETAPSQMMMIALLGIAHPTAAAAAQFLWVAGRVLYSQGYATGDPQARLPGVAISGLVYVLTIVACAAEGGRMVFLSSRLID